MHLRKRKKLLVGVILLAISAVFFRYAGILIVAEDFPEKADLIIVLMGSGPDRILWAVDLYKEGYAPCILMVENWEPGYELLESRGVKVPRDADVNATLKLGQMLGKK